MAKRSNLKKILVVTPTFSGGSWVATEKVLGELVLNTNIFVVGLGEVKHKNRKFEYFSIPYPKYEMWGRVHSSSLLFALFWNIPLAFCFALFLLYKRPHLVIANGFSSSLLLSPLIKLTGANFIVLYHGIVLGFMSEFAQKLVRFLSKFVNLVIVNSKGSFQDIKIVVPKEKILVSEHYADELFFEGFTMNRKRSSNLSVLYVGTLNKEKLFYPLVEVARKLRNNKEFHFTFVGIGTVQSEVEELSKESSNISYLGYIADRKELKKLYEKSDLLWSSADETYLTMPAVEALATGTPIIIPKYPGVYQRETKRVNKNLVPDEIGWLTNTNNLYGCYQLIRDIQKNGINQKMRKDCNDYARKHYSPSNLGHTIKKINNYLE